MMTGFIIFLAYSLIFLVLLGLLYYGLKASALPEPIKTGILIIVLCLGIIYFVSSGSLPELPRRP